MRAIGLEIGGTWLRGCVLRDGGVVGERLRERIPEAPERLGEALASIWERCGALPVVGLASAPELDDQGRVRRWPSSPMYEGADPCGALRARAVSPLILDDVSAAASAEHLAWASGQRAPSTTALLFVGTGVGGGVVLADQLWIGARGQAMDLGHMPVPSAAGMPCTCGRVGCLQAVVSGRRLERDAGAQGLAPGSLDELAVAGDSRAQELLDRMLAPLLEALVIIDRLLAPDRIILGGGVAEGRYLFGRLSAAALPAGCAAPVLRSRWGTWAGALGAALEAARRAGEAVTQLHGSEPGPPGSASPQPTAT
jgi:glucokinase